MRQGEMPRSDQVVRIDFNDRWEELHRESMSHELQNRALSKRKLPRPSVRLCHPTQLFTMCLQLHTVNREYPSRGAIATSIFVTLACTDARPPYLQSLQALA